MKVIKVAWFEIPVSDIERAVKFYEQIFDTSIQVQDFGQLKMGVFPHEDIGGALVESKDWYSPSPTDGPLLHLHGGDDLSTVLDKVEVAGGKVLIAKRQISEALGYMGVMIDSEGNRIALRSKN